MLLWAKWIHFPDDAIRVFRELRRPADAAWARHSSATLQDSALLNPAAFLKPWKVFPAISSAYPSTASASIQYYSILADWIKPRPPIRPSRTSDIISPHRFGDGSENSVSNRDLTPYNIFSVKSILVSGHFSTEIASSTRIFIDPYFLHQLFQRGLSYRFPPLHRDDSSRHFPP